VAFFAYFHAMERTMSETDRFVADCRAAFAQDPTHKAVREVLACAVSDPAAVLKGLGEPNRPQIQALFHSDALTILNVVWAPGMMVMPHNHRMWAVIGIYAGREDNVFWRRVKGTSNKIEAAGAKGFVRWMQSLLAQISFTPSSIRSIS
jgi:predicted metal-dependent enzyme (double-stranded beta helix superfamily)